MSDDAITGKVSRQALLSFFDTTLDAASFADYCPNGLQVQGVASITRLVSGVTASLRLIEAAQDYGANALLVHHGYFWRGEDPRIIGIKQARLARLLASGMNLFAYHLPLDAHESLGNNALLARQLGWQVGGRCGANGLVFYCDFASAITVAGIADLLADKLGQVPLTIGPAAQKISRIAWCTGAAQDYLGQAIEIGADAYISGEVSERTTHEARENGVAYFAAGHHATERYGVQALAAAAAREFGLKHQFIDDPNPV